jgi:threonine dehydrogenase-like Zn-dependent dehydrogenase
MRALVFSENRLRYRTDYPVPEPQRDEALIMVTHAGICNTDIEITKGYMEFEGVLGHEFVGIVKTSEQDRLIGKRVVGEINIGCGSCSFCRDKLQNHCPDRSVLGILRKDGVFAEYITLPLRNLHILPDSISDLEAVFIEPLAAAFEITRQIKIKHNEDVCVLGDGKLGLLVGQVLSLIGCRLVVIGRHKDKLSILKERGIETRLGSEFNEKRFDTVIDCTGSPSGLKTALKIVKPRGRIVIKTTTVEETPIDLNNIVVNEITLIGSRCGPFPQAIKAIETGEIALHSLINKVFPLEEGIEAFKYASRRGVLKVILKII